MQEMEGEEEGGGDLLAALQDDRSPIWFRPTLQPERNMRDVRLGKHVPFCVVAHTPQEEGFGYCCLAPSSGRSVSGKHQHQGRSVSGLDPSVWVTPPEGALSCTVGVDFTLSRAFGQTRLDHLQAVLGVAGRLPVFQFVPLVD